MHGTECIYHVNINERMSDIMDFVEEWEMHTEDRIIKWNTVELEVMGVTKRYASLEDADSVTSTEGDNDSD